MAAGRHFRIEAVFRGQLLALGLLQLLCRLVEILDLEAEMMDAAEIGAVGADIGVLFCLEIKDGKVDVAVGQKHRAARITADLAHSECFLVKGRGLCRILGRQRDVFDSRHVFLLDAKRT